MFAFVCLYVCFCLFICLLVHTLWPLYSLAHRRASKKKKKEKRSLISPPRNLVHKLHIDENLNWIGNCAENSESLFETVSVLGYG